MSAEDASSTPPTKDAFWLLLVPEAGPCLCEQHSSLDALLGRLRQVIASPEAYCYVYVFHGRRLPTLREAASGVFFLDLDGEKVALSTVPSPVESLRLVEEAFFGSADEPTGFVFDRK